jgi:hypothetical protein
MNNVMTVEEMEVRYAPEWVLIGDPETDAEHQIRAGRVLFHSHDRDEVCRKALDFPPGRYAVRFLGKLPEDVVLVL